MTGQEFAQSLKDEKESMLSSYFGRGESAGAAVLKKLAESNNDESVLKEFIDSVLTDAFYTILLGLDGETTLGRLEQQGFKVNAADGSSVCAGDGELANSAFNAFYSEE